MTYTILQQYWWFIISLLGALLVFLMFVQGANSLVYSLGYTEDGQRKIIESTGRKWEITFTTLVTFGGAFFASFPLFYSTSFGGAYWLLNGIIGPLLLGAAVATFFNGSNFFVEKASLTNISAPVISRWANASAGLDALLDPWNLVLGFAVMFLARILGILYIINNVKDEDIRSRGSVRLIGSTVPFLVLFLAFFIRTMLKDGYAVDPATGVVFMEPMKYLHNYLDMWPLAVLTVIGVVLLLYGIVRTILSSTYIKGIWPAGIGVVLVVLSLLLVAGWGNTAYYPSNTDLQCSLTIANSCSSEFTLRTMFYVSLLVPFVFGYIAYVWRVMDRK